MDLGFFVRKLWRSLRFKDKEYLNLGVKITKDKKELIKSGT